MLRTLFGRSFAAFVLNALLQRERTQILYCYNSAVFRKIGLAVMGLAGLACVAQESSAPQQKPEVKVHMLNVCTPSADEQQQIAAALAHVPRKPAFSDDFEVDRGRSILDQNANPLAAVGQGSVPAEKTIADFVRIRHDLTGAGPYSTVQYSFSRDSEQMVETLVFRVRDPKDLLQVSIEDSASAVTPASAMLGSATPASRIKLERFGKSSVVLARCSASESGVAADQSKYEPLFASATSVLSDYRAMLQAKTLIPEELSRIRRTGGSPKPASSQAAKRP
jgi:hypothetical protein